MMFSNFFTPVKTYLVTFSGEISLNDSIPFTYFVEFDGYKIFYDPLNYKLDEHNELFAGGIQIFGNVYVQTKKNLKNKIYFLE